MVHPQVRLLVGLGNPGGRYAQTRHNVGFMVADALTAAAHLKWRQAPGAAALASGALFGRNCYVVKPLAYMNRSGEPTWYLTERLKISIREMLVIHDDLDLNLGRIKIKEKGGDGGHRGLRSLTEAFGSGDYARLRIGIGRPKAGSDVTDHVLGDFSAEQRSLLPQIVKRAGEAVASTLREGVSVGMNRFNGMPDLHINSV